MQLFGLSQKSRAFLTNPKEILLCLIVLNHDTWPGLPQGVLVKGLVSAWALQELKIAEDDQRRKLEWALHQPNLWASAVYYFCLWKWRKWIQRICGSPEVPQEVFWDQKLDSGPTPYNIIAASEFLKYWSWKSLMNKLGNRKLNAKNFFKVTKLFFPFFSIFFFQFKT